MLIHNDFKATGWRSFQPFQIPNATNESSFKSILKFHKLLTLSAIRITVRYPKKYHLRPTFSHANLTQAINMAMQTNPPKMAETGSFTILPEVPQVKKKSISSRIKKRNKKRLAKMAAAEMAQKIKREAEPRRLTVKTVGNTFQIIPPASSS